MYARLGRMTEWRDTGDEVFIGEGTKLYWMDGRDRSILDIRTIEFRHDFTIAALPGPWQASAFVDSGRVLVYKDPFLLGPNSARLSSAGVGLHWSAPHDWVVGASVATPVGSKPALLGPHASTSTRFWLQVQRGFY